MKRKIKVWLIIALSFVMIGSVLFAVSMSKLNWNFKNIGQQNFVTNEYEITKEFNNISINVGEADVEFKSSTDGSIKVVCYEEKNQKHKTSVENGQLKIQLVNNKKWYEYLELNFCTPKITIYIPNYTTKSLDIKVSTGDVLIPENFTFNSISISGSTSDIKCLASSINQTKIHLSTGDIVIENASAKSYDLSVSTGDIKLYKISCLGEIILNVTTGDCYLKNVNCNSFVSTGSTGDIKLEKLIAVEQISILRNTGDINFYKSDANELVLTTSTGDVEGSLSTSKIFITKTKTGEIDVPVSTSGGKCQITTDTGDIEIKIAE